MARDGLNETLALLGAPLRSFGARAATLPIVAVAGLLTTRLVVGGLGADGYATYALIVGLAALVPFVDLGLGAAVTDAVARGGDAGIEHTLAVVRRSRRVLALVGIAVAFAAWLLAALQWWAPLLGLPASSEIELASAVGFTLFGASIPLSLGARILQGAERNHLAVALQALSALTALVVVALASIVVAPLWVFVSGPFLGTFLVAAVTTVVADRVTGIALFATSPERQAGPVKLIPVAGPMLVILIAEPVAWQADRIILSHFSTVEAVGQYSVGFQLFAPLAGLIAASGASLWGTFARRRQSGLLGQGDLLRVVACFSSVGLILSVALLVLGPALAAFMGHGQIQVPMGVFIAFGIVLILYAAWAPLGMALTHPAGLRVQAGLTAMQLAINLPLSASLATAIGAPGPILATAVAMATAMLVSLPFVRRGL